MAASRFQNFRFLSRETKRDLSNGAALKGNSTTIQEKVHFACRSPFLRQRCYELEAILQQFSSKELQSIFPFLLDNIFGYNGHTGWGLHQLQSVTNLEDFHTLVTFMGPEGALLHAVYKQQADQYIKYDFPVSNLPNQVQENLGRGNVPSFYQNKLNRTSTHVQLNPFEFFMFNFAYFVVSPGNQKFLNIWAVPEDCFYPYLLDKYLCYFLPYDGRMVPPIPAGFLSPARTSSSGASPTNRQSGKMERSPLIRDEASSFYHLSSPSSSSSLFNSSSHHGQGATSEGETWRSEVFIQALVDFWLNQNSIASQNKSLFRQVQDNFIPSLDHVRAVRILIKHLHFFVNSAPRDPTPYKQSPETTLNDLKRHILPVLVQKPLYVFLRHGFDHWPLDVSFRQILEVWLSYIQPWRYSPDSLPGGRYNQNSTMVVGQRSQIREQRSMNVQDGRWKKFISENIPIYTVLFQEFIPRALRQDLSNAKNALMVFRVAKVFAQPHLMDLLTEAECHMLEVIAPTVLQSSFSSTTSILSNSHLSHGQHQQCLQVLALEGQSFQYKPLTSETARLQVTQLLQVIAQAKSNLTSLNRLQLGSLGEDLSNWFNLDAWFGGHPQIPGNAALVDDIGPMNTRRAGDYLDKTLEFLADAFEVPDTHIVSAGVHEDPLSRRDKDLPPDTTEDGTLTDLGRIQMANGYRRFDVEYLGDPDLQPIRTFENATFVRLLYTFCCFINRKYDHEIQEVYSRPDFLGSVAKQYLRAPAISSQSPRKKSSSFVSCRTDHRPRLSLRFLASYRTIGYALLLLFLAYLFGFSTTGVILIVTLCIVFYGLIGGAIYHLRGETDRNHSHYD
ncbi:sphingomyelin phosphodiesterase 4-like isoform X2 [Apostichopus japonicus]|uniref:sphingomyelin phosphodiesterase 4-like isoform X2 n=1 Tax=Stichopus japonicus TaxID=307972 RepID=UPI003AB633BB